MKESVKYGSSLIKFDLEYSDRKTLGIKVFPDKRVEVNAPIDSATEKIKEKVKSKANWILKQQDFFLSFHPLTPPRRYISGETHLYLGKQYRLKIIKSDTNSVKLYAGYINVYCMDYENKTLVKKLLNNWYKEKAKIHFHDLFKVRISNSKLGNKTKPALQYKWMKNRWGTCNVNGLITLNLELIKAPKVCIEYVIVHEICHLSYLNHSKSFYNLLKKHFPNWRETKHQLEHFMV